MEGDGLFECERLGGTTFGCANIETDTCDDIYESHLCGIYARRRRSDAIAVAGQLFGESTSDLLRNVLAGR